jgi:hypothetical protein
MSDHTFDMHIAAFQKSSISVNSQLASLDSSDNRSRPATPETGSEPVQAVL